jgi:hypothetical protein
LIEGKPIVREPVEEPQAAKPAGPSVPVTRPRDVSGGAPPEPQPTA